MMKPPHALRPGASWLVAALLALATAQAAAAITEGRTNDGRRYLAGGIGTEEVDALRAQASAYSLQLVMAARSGAYLAGTQLRLTGPGNAVILETMLDAPWLLIDLPAGRYAVRATHSGETVERQITIGDKAQRIVLHFNVPADNAGPGAASEGATGTAR